MTASYRDTPAITLVRQLTRACQTVQGLTSGAIAPFDLPPGEFDILMALGNTEGLRMCDLASRTLTTPPNITRLVTALERKGIVDRQRNPQSAREVIARLTPSGIALFESAYPAIYLFWRDRFDAIFSAAEQDALIAFLDRLVAPFPPTA